MTILTLSIAKSIRHKTALLSMPRVNWKAIYLLGISLALLMTVYYIFLVNQLTEGVYLIRNYNKEINILYNENEALEANFAQADFLERVMSRTEELSFEKTRDIKYLQILESSLAKAK